MKSNQQLPDSGSDVSDFRIMHLLPQSRDAWGKFLYFPFRAFVLAAFIMMEIVPKHMPRYGDFGGGGYFIIIGYVGCFMVFLAGGIVQMFTHREKDAIANFTFVVVTLLIGYHSLGYLAR